MPMPTLTTLKELIAFAAGTECMQCKRDAIDMIYMIENSPAEGPHEIEFDTDCEHNRWLRPPRKS